jgi:ribosomal protein S18 acetylase RimI-like enzyme
MSEVVLYVAVENAPALALYAHKGFRQVRRIQGFYRTGDAFEMLLRVGRLRESGRESR